MHARTSALPTMPVTCNAKWNLSTAITLSVTYVPVQASLLAYACTDVCSRRTRRELERALELEFSDFIHSTSCGYMKATPRSNRSYLTSRGGSEGNRGAIETRTTSSLLPPFPFPYPLPRVIGFSQKIPSDILILDLVA